MSEYKSDKLTSERAAQSFVQKKTIGVQNTTYAVNKSADVSKTTVVMADSEQKLSLNNKNNRESGFQKNSELKIGDSINRRFVLVSELGRGGMGVVYKARDLRKEEARDRNPFIALKVLSDDFKSNPDSFIALQRETRKTQDLAHPNIVTVYDFDKDGEHVYMTMECLDGKPLSTLLHEQHFKNWSILERWELIKQICSALAYAHKKNIIHLDLKPGNIYLRKDGVVKVLDFGIARISKNVDNTETAQDTTIFDAGKLGALTPPYASCEMLENQEPDFRDDIYALACVAYEVLTNDHPFNKMPATQARFNKLNPPPIAAINKKQRKALKHALAFNRVDRVPTVDQFLQEAQLLTTNVSVNEMVLSKKVMAIVLTVMVIVVVFWLNMNNLETQVIPVSESQLQNREQQTRIETGLNLLSEKDQQKVFRMLEIAEMHFMVGRLVEPKGTNALEAYNAVLALVPGNSDALEGVKKIADFYEQQAREQWKKGNKKSSLSMLNKGLTASPTHKGLSAFKEYSGLNEND